MSSEFAGKTVVITGAAGNLGRAVVKRFAEGGARLALLDHHAERLQALQAEYGAETLTETVDLGDVAAVDALFARWEASGVRLDGVVHTVGGFVYGKPVHEENIETLERMFNLNVRPIYVFCGRAARHMVEHQIAGKIVMVLARAAFKGAANTAAYTATKAAAQRLMESMSLELRDQGINVNGVAPSIIDTPPNRQDMPKADFSKWVTTDDLASAIAYLASDGARSLHGTTLEVYGRV